MYATDALVVLLPMSTSLVFGREICMGAKNVDLVVVILSELLLWPDSDTLALFRPSRVYAYRSATEEIQQLLRVRFRPTVKNIATERCPSQGRPFVTETRSVGAYATQQRNISPKKTSCNIISKRRKMEKRKREKESPPSGPAKWQLARNRQSNDTGQSYAMRPA
jgi:hypothetical protein